MGMPLMMESLAATDPTMAWVIGCVIGVPVLILIWMKWRAQTGEERRRSAAFAAHQLREDAAAAANEKFHVIGAAKLQTEADLLSIQLQLAKSDLASRERNDKFNELAVEKMRKELDLLDLQTQLAKRDVALRMESHDYHDLMFEKTKLEIECLKLQVKEQSRRLDEFGTYGD